MGERLAETPKNKGAMGIGTSAVPKENHTPTLADMGINKKLSARSQKDYDCALKICRVAGPYTR